MERAIEVAVIRVWVIMKMTLIFWLLSLSGLIIFGVGPALKAITELYLSHSWEYKEITLKEAYKIWRRDFSRANFLFWFFAILSALLIYNLYLSIQIQGLLFLVIDFVLIFILTYMMTALEYALILDSQFEISLGNLLKISFISNFSNFFTYLKLLIGCLVILVITWQYKGLILFGMAGLMQVYCVFVTKDWRAKLDEQLAE